MKFFNYAIILLVYSSIIGSCSTVNIPPKDKIKPHPEYVGVDARMKPYVDEYFKLSAEHHITFTKSVTVGIKKINEGSVIGYCTTTPEWREIDIDQAFFKENSPERRKILAFHELTHCYCTRGHDFKGKDYPPIAASFFSRMKVRFERGIPWCIDKNQPGMLEDGCPASIMHPYILDQQCIKAHYDYYIDEMFEGCTPY